MVFFVLVTRGLNKLLNKSLVTTEVEVYENVHRGSRGMDDVGKFLLSEVIQ